MRRALGKFELGTVISDQNAVFNVVGAVFLEGMPLENTLRQALDILQNRHPFLQAKLVKSGKDYVLDIGDTPKIPLRVIEREHDSHWIEYVEEGVSDNVDSDNGPLIVCSILVGPESKGEIILTIHHVVADGPCLESLVEETLTLCALLEEGEEIEGFEPLSPLPPVEEFFPGEFQGLSLRRKLAAFFLREMWGELNFQFRLRGEAKHPIPENARGKIIPMSYSKEDTHALVRMARQNRVTINSVINAAMLLSVQKHLYKGEAMLYRYMAPGDLRPYIEPPASRIDMGGYVTPLRFTVPILDDDDLWSLAARINEQIYNASKHGVKYLMSLMTAQVMQMVFMLNKFRMSTTAITYSGPSLLKSNYGPFKVRGMRGFVSNFGQGPEYSAGVGIFNDELWWNIHYLDKDMDQSLALQIAEDIRGLILAGVAGVD